MNHKTADRRKPAFPSGALAGNGRLLDIRFFTGIVIAIGGASVLLSDLIHLVPSLS